MYSNVLKNFVIHANAHNKYLEESEMWKKRKDELNSKPINSVSMKRRSRSRSSSRHKRKCINDESIGPSLKLFESAEKWDHNGFKELYPNGYESEEKWDHSGYKELYPNDRKSEEKWDHSGYKELYPNDYKRKTSKEIWKALHAKY